MFRWVINFMSFVWNQRKTTCIKQKLVLKGYIFNNHCSTFHINLTCFKRSPVFKDHTLTLPWVVIEHRFDYFKRFNPAPFLCLFQAVTWISNGIYMALSFFFLFSEIRWEVIVRFVDIGRIVSHHCLSFLYFCWYWQNCWPSLFKLSLFLLILAELLTISV
jgi:hypothetical protein